MVFTKTTYNQPVSPRETLQIRYWLVYLKAGHDGLSSFFPLFDGILWVSYIFRQTHLQLIKT